MMQLPDANEPLVLADGTKIDPATGKVIREKVSNFITVPSPSEAQKLVVKARRSVAELPMPPKQLSGVALVAFYTLFGLPDAEISIALNAQLSIDQIAQIKNSDAYTEFMEAAKSNILNTQVDTVREVFQTHARSAAEKIVEFVGGENDVLAFKSAQDILDRAGHRPADIVEHRHTMEDALHIVITRRDETQTLPIIDAEATEIDNA